MKKKIFPIAIAIAVTALFVLPGLAFGAGGGGNNGTPSPPPTNPPCDSDGHNNQPPPYGGPNKNSHSCGATGNATGNATGHATGTSSTTSTGSSSTTTSGAVKNLCDWNVTVGGNTVIPNSDIPGAIGVHVDLPPDPASHTTGSLIHACLGVGSVVNPLPHPCPTGTAPIEAQTDQKSFLLLCVLL